MFLEIFCQSNRSCPKVLRVEVKVSVLGLLLFPSKAQKSPCQLPISTPSSCYEPTNTPLKRVAIAQGKKPQNCNMQAQEFRWALGFMGEGGGGCIIVCFLPVVCWLSLMYLFHMNEQFMFFIQKKKKKKSQLSW